MKVDNYRHSLEQRLDKLFKEEKDLLKERHFANSYSRSQYHPKESASNSYGVNRLKTSNSIDNMERKIRLLVKMLLFRRKNIDSKKEGHQKGQLNPM